MDGFERRVKHLSRGLVEFQTRDLWEQYEPGMEGFDREAQFIHQSVPDYLMQHIFDGGQISSRTPMSLAAAGHFEISRSCLKYLTLRDILDSAHLLRGPLSARFPLAPYAVRFLFRHIRKVDIEGVAQADLLHLIQWDRQSELLRKISTSWRVLDLDNVHTPMGWPFIGATVFHILIAFGSTTTFNELLQRHDLPLDGRDREGNTPLLLAIRETHYDMALALLSRHEKHQCQEHAISTGGRSETDTNTQMKCLVGVNAENVDGETPMVMAFTERADDVLLQLIDQGAELQTFGSQSELICYAIWKRNTVLIGKLVEKKIILDGAVHFALAVISTPNESRLRLKIVSQLLKGGASPRKSSLPLCLNEIPGYHGNDETYEAQTLIDDPMHIASRDGDVSMVEVLLKHGARPHEQNEYRKSPLGLALAYGHDRVVEMLIEHDPSVIKLGFYDYLDDDWAALGRLVKRLFSEGHSSDRGSSPFRHLFFCAIFANDLELARAVVEKTQNVIHTTDRDGKSALDHALANGNEEMALFLIAQGHAVSFTDESTEKRSYLLEATKNGLYFGVEAILRKDKSTINFHDESGMSVLLYALEVASEELAIFLITEGQASVNDTGPAGRTPLIMAIRSGLEQVVNAILESDKTSMSMADSSGMMPLSHALDTANEEIAICLIDKGHDVNCVVAGWEMTTLVAGMKLGLSRFVKKIVQVKASLGIGIDDQDVMALAYAVFTGFPEVENALLDIDAPAWIPQLTKVVSILRVASNWNLVDCQVNHDDKTALMSVVLAGQQDLTHMLVNGGKALFLDMSDSQRMTLLFLAVLDGQRDLTQALVDRGGTSLLGMSDSQGRTALMYALQTGNSDIAKILSEGEGKALAKYFVDNDRKDALWYAVDQGHCSIAESLLEENDSGMLVLDRCSQFVLQAPDELVEKLLRHPLLTVDFMSCHPAWLSGELETLRSVDKDAILRNYQQFAPIVIAAAIPRTFVLKILIKTWRICEKSLQDALLVANKLGRRYIAEELENALKVQQAPRLRGPGLPSHTIQSGHSLY